jgi:hypothetical protein
MPLDKKKLRQFKKDAFNKMPLIKVRVVVVWPGFIISFDVEQNFYDFFLKKIKDFKIF